LKDRAEKRAVKTKIFNKFTQRENKLLCSKIN